MKKFFGIQSFLVIVFVVFLGAAGILLLQNNSSKRDFSRDNASFDTTSFSQYERGEVVEVLEERIDEAPQNKLLYQYVVVELISGENNGQLVETEFTQIVDTAGDFKFTAGDKVVLGKLSLSEENLIVPATSAEYVIVDRLRTNGLLFAVLLFVVFAVIFAGVKGLLSIGGLAITIFVLVFFTAPQLLAGQNPILVASITAGLVAIATMFISHGFNNRTKVSVVSTIISLFVAILFSYLFVYGSQLFGLGQADAFLIQSGYFGEIDLRGLLLAGLIISLLGILDDVTTTQTATVAELTKANPDYTFKQLYVAGMSVGREHIASLINTLVLVYVGAALPLFLLLVAATDQPLWVLLNSEHIAEEIIRAIAGSTALILGVPISTLIAAYYYKQNSLANKNTH